MNKLFTLILVGSALALSACAQNKGADYGYETQAPYADERTEGAMQQPAPAERVFNNAQQK